MLTTLHLVYASLLCVGAALAILWRFYMIRSARNRSASSSVELGKNLRARNARISDDYDHREIRTAAKGYIEPDCSQTDPANEPHVDRVLAVREPIFQVLDRHVNSDEKTYVLVLADSGMGKTTFCLNYVARLNKAFEAKAVLISLARPGALDRINVVEAHSDTILILDALDEDVEAFDDAVARLHSLLEASQRFRTVIVTCRSQFFEDDESIPRETGIARITPRAGAGGNTYLLSKTYLLPFDAEQTSRYIRHHFPWWSLSASSNRGVARRLVETIPELSVRPMLLALIPDLSRADKSITELADLYQFMVDNWVGRESRWIEPDRLLSASKKVAVILARHKQSVGSDRIDAASLKRELSRFGEPDIEWRNLTTRSLLNRDSNGRLKFAHRSIMEFLLVKVGLEDATCLREIRWTDFMRDVLISYVYSADGNSPPGRAAVAQLLDNMRKTGAHWPLHDPLPGPMTVSRQGILAQAEILASGRRRRPLPSWLKSHAIVVVKNDGVILIHDYERGLLWRFVDPKQAAAREDFDLYRVSASNISSRRYDNGFRLPSCAEFMSLCRIARDTRSSWISPSELYWLGDQSSFSGYLLASLSPIVAGEGLQHLVVGERLPGMSDTTITVMGIDVRRAGPQFANLRALELQVRVADDVEAIEASLQI